MYVEEIDYLVLNNAKRDVIIPVVVMEFRLLLSDEIISLFIVSYRTTHIDGQMFHET